MSLFEIIAILLTLAALFSYINCRTIKLPTTIGIMLIALLFSLGLIFFGKILSRDPSMGNRTSHQGRL